MTEHMSRYKVLAVRKPGQKGTKRLTAQYGSRLRCVRYVFDRLTGERFKTIELIQYFSNLEPCELNQETLVGVRIRIHEFELRDKVKRLGGRWDPYDKIWILRYKDLEVLGLEDREICIREEDAAYQA